MTGPGDPRDPGRPFSEWRDTGLLWLVNRAVFHPRGYALALHYDADGTVSGWSLLGDGTAPWSYGPPVPEDELFAKVRELLP